MPTSIQPSGFFALRSPLLPHDELAAWSADLEAIASLGDPAALERALEADRVRLRERMRAVLARPEVREALFVASPTLEESLCFWEEAPESERGQKVERTLVRYFTRMAGRPTPFGLFAGCSVGLLGNATRLTLEERRRYRRHTRLDMDYVFSLTEELARHPALRDALIYRPNSSLYLSAGRLRYAEARLNGRARSHHLVAVEPLPHLRATLERAHAGATLRQLAQGLLGPEVSYEEAEELIAELIDFQLLVSELSPLVTGQEPTPELVARLRKIPDAEPVAEGLGEALRRLEALDAGGLGAEPERYREVAEVLEQLPTPVELPRLFQVDMVKPAAAATLGPGPVAALARAVEILHRITPVPPSEPLKRFKEAFLRRYEGQEVPLVEALDEESGIGLDSAGRLEPSPLIEGLHFPPANEDERIPWGARQTFLLRRLERATRTGARELSLTAEDLQALEISGNPPLPDAFAVLGTLVGRSAEAVDAGDFQLLVAHVPGPSGAVLLGRFCHADPALHEHVLRHLREEEALQPDAVFAEIVHLPEGRIGNILCRPLLRQHEIPYLGRSGAPREQQLPVADLLVSVVEGRIVLRSARLGRRVIPRMSNAHNFMRRGLGVYRFLCELQRQDVAHSLGWRWGPLSGAAFLPRDTCGRLVLSLARWNLEPEHLKAIGGQVGPSRFTAIQALRRELDLPRHVEVEDGDNVLPVDLENVLALETLAQLLKDRDHVTLVEQFPGEEGLCLTGPEGRFVHELVVPFVRVQGTGSAEALPPSAPAPLPPPAPTPIVRSFPPGSEWLYAKLYVGSATADRVLRQVIRPVVGEALGSGAAEGWFFIRYGDPDWHLRLRLWGNPERLRSEVMGQLESALAPFRAEAPSGGSSWTPTSARSSATGAPRRSSSPRRSSGGTARRRWSSWSCTLGTRTPTRAGG